MSQKSIKSLLLNHLMLNGKKNISEKILTKSVKKVQKKNLKKNPYDLIKIAVINSSPHIFLKKIKRKKKMTTEFPFLLDKTLRTSYGTKFIIKAARDTSVFYFLSDKIYSEILDASKFKGSSINTILESSKKAFITKKLSNYRWF